MITLQRRGEAFAIIWEGGVLLRHAPDAPCFAAGFGDARIAARRGNFTIADVLRSRTALAHVDVEKTGEGFRLAVRPLPGQPAMLLAFLALGSDEAVLRFAAAEVPVNRVWLRLPAEPGEAVWGGGEQFSYFNLAGRRYRLWTSEPGVGRDKESPVARAADEDGGAGGDYDHTYCPQPSFLSSRGHALHVETTAYAAFDFRDPAAHEIEIWAIPDEVRFFVGRDRAALVRRLGAHFGSPPALPGWVDQGVVLGLKRGDAHAREKYAHARRAGIPLAALWCEDWAGVRETAFGTRLFWDWRARPTRYPDLALLIDDLHREGLRFLGYVNPHL